MAKSAFVTSLMSMKDGEAMRIHGVNDKVLNAWQRARDYIKRTYEIRIAIRTDESWQGLRAIEIRRFAVNDVKRAIQRILAAYPFRAIRQGQRVAKRFKTYAEGLKARRALYSYMQLTGTKYKSLLHKDGLLEIVRECGKNKRPPEKLQSVWDTDKEDNDLKLTLMEIGDSREIVCPRHSYAVALKKRLAAYAVNKKWVYTLGNIYPHTIIFTRLGVVVNTKRKREGQNSRYPFLQMDVGEHTRLEVASPRNARTAVYMIQKRYPGRIFNTKVSGKLIDVWRVQ